MLIYTNSNRLLVENAKNMLENAGIELLVKNEYLAGAAGDLAPGDTWLELWLADLNDIPKARKILEVLESEVEGHDWNCANCNEVNYPNFNLCWNCQHRR